MIPVVLHHGFFGFSNFRLGSLRFCYFGGGIEQAIERRGHRLIVSKVHPTAGIQTRARALKAQILEQLRTGKRQVPRQRAIIIAHSMGGLDARYMISRLGMADFVEALVTISTPHRGNAFALWCLRNLGKRLGGLALAKLLGIDVQGMDDLTPEHCARFNEQVEDAPGVRYYSITASRPWNRVPAFALHAWRVMQQAEGDNDCLVSVRSAIWGTHLETWPVDHYHQVNKRFVIDPGGVGNVSPLYVRLLDLVTADRSVPGSAFERRHEGAVLSHSTV